jgi:hypothetical protein
LLWVEGLGGASVFLRWQVVKVDSDREGEDVIHFFFRDIPCCGREQRRKGFEGRGIRKIMFWNFNVAESAV